MRQAINNLQSTVSGFGFVNAENVFKVCDQPHPVIVSSIVDHSLKADIEGALVGMKQLWRQGYSGVDIVTTLFRVVRNYEDMQEYMKLQFLKVTILNTSPLSMSNTTIGNWSVPYESFRRCFLPSAVEWSRSQIVQSKHSLF
jgi:DNA polymerase III delta prime subunit